MIESSDLRMTKIPLNHGAGHMPALGFGTLIPDPAATITATRDALEAGFRHFDCAERYKNEREVGSSLQAGLADGRIAREDIFVTTKLWNSNHRPERVEPAFEASLDRLALKYLDLYLIHTPFAFQPGDDQDPRDQNGNVLYDHDVTLLDTWRAMESLVDHGKCRAIGLSDIDLNELKPLYESARIKPAVVQVEAHPYLPETELLEFCREKGVVFLAFAPLGHGIRPGPLEDPVTSAIAARVGKTPAQVLLAWAVQRGTAFLTTPRTAARARENFDISSLPDDALDEINRIQTRQRLNAVVKTGVPGFIPQGRLEALVGAEAEADVVGGPLALGVAEFWAQGFSDFSDIGGSFGGRQG
jgi:aldehyde reductase